MSVSVIFRSFLAKIPRLQPYLLANIGSFSSLFNLQSKSINFNFGHLSLIFGRNTKAIALLFGQNWLIFITFHSAIKFNQFQFRSFVAHFWPKYQGNSLTFWPKLAHFHHFSICNQSQSISLSVICRLIFGQITKAIALLFCQHWLNFITFQSAIKINQFQFRSFLAHFWPRYQGYSLTVLPILAHFHHFSICNQNQSISISVISRSFLAKIPRLQPYFLAKIGSFSSLFTLQSNSINFTFGHISLIFGQNTKAIALPFGENWLIFISFQSAIKVNQCQFRSFFAHVWPNYQGYSLTFWPKLAHFHHFSLCNQIQSISISVIFRSFLAKLPRLQPYCSAKIGSFSSLFNLHSQSINFNFGHFSLISRQNTKAIALLFGQTWLIFIIFQSALIINQFQFRSFFAHFSPNHQGYSLTFWPKLAHFHHFSIWNQNQSISVSVILRSFLAKIPRLLPYFFAKIGSFSSLFNLQSKSINFNFGHFSLNFWPNYQGYSLTFWPILAHFHHFSICNHNRSISISVIFRSFLAKIPRLQPYFLAKIGSVSSLFNLQSKSIKFNFGHFSLSVGHNTKAIALLFGQHWLIFITFQSANKINQFQFRSFVAHFWPKYQGYSLTFWQKLAHFHHFSICNQNQSISFSVSFRSFLAKIPRLQPYFLAKIGSFSSLFNLQSQSINFNFGHFSLIFGQNTKAIALPFGQHWLIFITVQSAIKVNQFQFRSFFAHFWPKYQGYSLTFWPNLAHFHHFSICNQTQSISFLVSFRSFLAKIPRLQPYFLAKMGSFSSLFNLQSKSINFSFGHFSLIFGQNTKAIALPFGQTWLIFITFQSAIKLNQFHFWSVFAHFWPKYQGYSLTFWPQLAHVHHFSICNQNQSISIYVIFRSFLAIIPRLQPYFLAKIGSFSSLFNLQSNSINFIVGQLSLIFGQNTKAITLLFGQNWLIFITFQSAIKINQFHCQSLFAHFWPKYQGYSLTFLPTMAHFHHFSICNQNQSISVSVIFRSFLAKIPRLQPYFLATIGSCPSLFNLQSNSINFNLCDFSLIFGQTTKAIALLFGQYWLIFITCQSAIKINQFQIRSFLAHLWPKYQGYSLTYRPKLAHFHHFSICNQSQSISLSVIFRLIFGQTTKALALLFGQYWLIFITFQSAIKINQCQFRSFFAHFWPKYQGYSLTFWPKLAHFHHFSICNQNQSISLSVIFRLIFGQTTKAIALLFGQYWLIFITFQSAIKINQFQFRSFLAQFWPNYQGYSLTVWPKLAHCHHFSLCNQIQSISISVIFRSFLATIPRLQPYCLAKIGSFSSHFNLHSQSINFNFGHFSLIFGQTTKAIALLFGQYWLIFITFQSAIKINQFHFRSFFAHFWPKYQGYSLTFLPTLAHFHHFSICNQNQSMSGSVIFRSFLAKIPRLQPYLLAKIGSFSSLFNLQSKSINFTFGPFSLNVWPNCQGYSLTFWPILAHFHHFSICNQNQSISISVIFRSILAKLPRLQPYFLAKIGSFSSLFTLQSNSINFTFGHFSLIFGQNTKAIALPFGQNWLIFITFQSAIKVNQFHFRSFFA